MGSIIKVNEYKDFGNNAIMTSDGAGVITPNADGIKNTPSFRAGSSAYTSVANSTMTTLAIDTESWDTDSFFDTSTYKFTPTIAGKYWFSATAYLNSGNNTDYFLIQLMKNTSMFAQSGIVSNDYNSPCTTGAIDLNGSSDYVSVRVYQQTGGTVDIEGQNFCGFKLIGA